MRSGTTTNNKGHGKLINIAGLLEECKQYTKLYSVTHGDVLLDRIDKEGNIFLKVLPLDKNLTLKLDECGRLYEKDHVYCSLLYGIHGKVLILMRLQ